MRRAIELARMGRGHASPNPMVGAVILSPDGDILAEGYHRKAGQAHAEIDALANLDDPSLANGSTLVVTLEPCSTVGKTGACTGAIIESGFAKVVIGTTDPNPQHAGRGLELLRKAGVEVVCGVLEEECRMLNRAFNKWITTGLPWVILKAGMSLDGRITRPPGEGQWLTSEAARADVMELRAGVDAILVGANTLRTDNPKLNVRGIPNARQPRRIILAGAKKLLEDAHVLMDADAGRTKVIKDLPLPDLLADLGKEGVTSLLVEGGSKVHGEFLRAGLVDEVVCYLAPLLIGGGGKALIDGDIGGASLEIANVSIDRIGDDLRYSGLVVRKAGCTWQMDSVAR